MNTTFTDYLSLNFYNLHHEYVKENGLEKLTKETRRIYSRGEEIFTDLANSTQTN